MDNEPSLESIAEETQELPEEMLNKLISRRSFLKILGLGVAGAMLPREIDAKNKSIFISPFGGMKKPKVHACWKGTPQNDGAGYKRICPFDRYAAKRSGGRIHNALYLY